MKPSSLIPILLATLLSAGGIALAADPHAAPVPSATATIAATGVIKSVDAATGKLVIAHDPISALQWPAMTMGFQLAHQAMAAKVKAGDKVKFELKEGEKGAYLITAIEAAH